MQGLLRQIPSGGEPQEDSSELEMSTLLQSTAKANLTGGKLYNSFGMANTGGHSGEHELEGRDWYTYGGQMASARQGRGSAELEERFSLLRNGVASLEGGRCTSS